MDLRSMPIIGPVFDWAENFAAQGLGQRIFVYGLFYVVAVLLAGFIVKGFGLYTTLGVGGTLLVAVAFMALFLAGVDPDNQYTKQDVLALFVVAAIAPAVFWILASGATAGIAQVASPVVMLATAAASAAAQGTTAPTVSALAQYLGNFFVHAGALYGAMGLKYITTE